MCDPTTINDLDSNAAQQDREEQMKHILRDFRIIFRSIQTHSHRVKGRCGVSSVQLWAMWELFNTPDLKVSDLSKALSIHQSTASNMLDKLENGGLVTRERKGRDQRVVRLRLTDEGLRLLAEAPRPAQGALSDALRHLPDDVIGALYESIGRLVAVLPYKDEKAALTPLPEE